MLWGNVIEVLEALDQAAVRNWAAGGWVVDLLVGDYARCKASLNRLGYTVETNWLPLRVEVSASGERWVDVHPVSFDADGLGVQGDPEGVHFVYPPQAFTIVRLHGREIPCLSVEQQELFHSGYDPRPQDVHDLCLLAALPH